MQYELNILRNDAGCGESGNGVPCQNRRGCSEADEANSRRGFLHEVTTIALGSLSLTLLPVSADSLAGEDPTAGIDGDLANQTNGGSLDRDEQVIFGFLVDTEICIGAGKCLTACRIENDVPEGYARTWVERFVHFKDGRVQVDLVPETGFAGSGLPTIDPEEVDRAYFVPKLCNQCVDAPCNQVCPVHASFTSPEGIELVDPERCIGCAYCVQACPYGVRFINPKTNNADKCTWCYHRIMRDEQPACVEACPVGARIFGRLDDPESELSKRIAEIPTNVLKPHLGTHPKLRYVGISGEVT